MPVAVGIDFGSTHCNVGVWHHDRPEIIANHHGLRATPALVAFTESEVLVGEAALTQMAKNAANTVYGFKWLVGRGHSELEPHVKEMLESAPFRVSVDGAGQASVEVTHKGAERAMSADALCGHLFRHLKSIAEHFSGEDVASCVLAVPPSFTEEQREALRAAGRAAGLPIALVVPDPVAAAIAYGLDRPDADAAGSSREGGGRDADGSGGSGSGAGDSGGGAGAAATAAAREDAAAAAVAAGRPKRTVVVVDWGGGGVTASVLSRHDGVLAVKATRSDPALGGDRFVRRLMEFCAKDFKRRGGGDPLEGRRSRLKLERACEETLKALSSSAQADVYVEALSDGVDLRVRVSRGRLEDMCADLFSSSRAAVAATLAAAGLVPADADMVLLAGGIGHMPRAQAAVRDCFPAGTPFGKGLFADEAVAIGATIQAWLLQDNPGLATAAGFGGGGGAAAKSGARGGPAVLPRQLACCPVTLAVDTAPPLEEGPTIVIAAGAVLPCQARASLQVARAPQGDGPSPPLTLHVLEVSSAAALAAREANGSAAPTRNSEGAGAACDGTHGGSSGGFGEPRLLGVLSLDGLPAGDVEVAVAFSLRSEGVLKVEAMETSSRKLVQLVIDGSDAS